MEYAKVKVVKLLNNWFQEIAEEDLKNDICIEFSRLIGFENTMKLIKTFGGSEVYIPKLDSLQRDKRDAAICKEFNGYNYRELAKKYTLSERQIREICREIIEKKKRESLKNQISIFEINS